MTSIPPISNVCFIDSKFVACYLLSDLYGNTTFVCFNVKACYNPLEDIIRSHSAQNTVYLAHSSCEVVTEIALEQIKITVLQWLPVAL